MVFQIHSSNFSLLLKLAVSIFLELQKYTPMGWRDSSVDRSARRIPISEPPREWQIGALCKGGYFQTKPRYNEYFFTKGLVDDSFKASFVEVLFGTNIVL